MNRLVNVHKLKSYFITWVGCRNAYIEQVLKKNMQKCLSVSQFVKVVYLDDLLYHKVRNAFSQWARQVSYERTITNLGQEAESNMESFNDDWTNRFNEEVERRVRSEEELQIVKTNFSQQTTPSRRGSATGWDKLRRKSSRGAQQLAFASSPTMDSSFSSLKSTPKSTPPSSPLPTMRRMSTVVAAAKKGDVQRKEIIHEAEVAVQVQQIQQVSERSERALMKTRILAINPAKLLPTYCCHIHFKLTLFHSILLTRSFCTCFIENAPRFARRSMKTTLTKRK